MATKHGVSELLLHNFPENGVKFLLHNPGNLADLMRLLALHYPTLVEPHGFDYAQRSIEPDTLIRSDFSHGVTDLLVRLPFRIGNQTDRWIELYMLIEHLSAHQRHIVPRSVGYAMDVYGLQERRWREQHVSLQGLEYELVVPIVIYTGERPWQAPTPFRKLVKGGEKFAALIPANEPLFLSLPSQSEQVLLQAGGTFGAMLNVLQHRHAEFERFHPLLTTTTQAVEEHLCEDQHRLRESLAYLHALVYHFRRREERPDLVHGLERSIQSPEVRKETHAVGQTIAEALREEGERKGERKGKVEGKLEGKLEAKQDSLIFLLRRKFGRKVTPAIVANIQKSQDLHVLDQWFGNSIDATTLEEVGIPLKK